MKTITYRINLYISIGKFSFDMSGDRRECIIVQVGFNNINIKHYKKYTISMSITELTVYHYA